jgi:regulator of replication initiation timing
MYQQKNSALNAAKDLAEDAKNDLVDNEKENERVQGELKAEVGKLQVAISDLEAQLNDVKRENTQLVQRIAEMGAAVELANNLQSSQLQLAQTAEQKVVALQADQTRLDTELKETNQMLIDKMAIVADLEAKNKQLVESNQELQTRLDQYLRQYGKTAAAPQVVTRAPAVAQPAPPAAKDIALNGKVTAVDMKNALAEISIGSATGVKQDMKFHVVRGEQFVCDILILDVDADKAVGILKRVQAEPRRGDVCTTNL